MKVGKEPAYKITKVSPIYPTDNNPQRNNDQYSNQNKTKDRNQFSDITKHFSCLA